MNARATIPISSTILLAALVTIHGADVSKQQADAFSKKLDIIAQQAESLSSGSSAAAARRTPVTESELNSWFAFHAQPDLPPGVTDPKMTLVGNGKVMGGATVDLEAVGKRRGSGGALDVWSYLGGRVPVTVTGVLHSTDGRGRFELQTAEVSGVPVPKMILQELVSSYSRTAERPQGIQLDDPFALPLKIKQIEIGAGQAVVVQ
jgi:hypothetical protein